VVFPLPSLTRAHGALIRALLQEKRVRAKEGAFVLEGAKSCLDLIRQRPDSVISITVSSRYLESEDEAGRRIRSKLTARQFHCTDAVFAKLSEVEAPQGILAIVRKPQWDENLVWQQARMLGIYGDGIRDPANVGAIIRTAAGLNLTALWLSADSADCYAPKVVRATAGGVLSLPIFYVASALELLKHNCSIYSAVIPSQDSVSLNSIEMVPRRLVLGVGNEGQGLTPETVKASQLKFSIPLERGVESLNVAAIVAIAAFYLTGLPTQD